jgi:hypothetical protein
MLPKGGPGVGVGDDATDGTGFGEAGSGEGDGAAARAWPALNNTTTENSATNGNARFINEKPPYLRSSRASHRTPARENSKKYQSVGLQRIGGGRCD